MRDTDTLRSRIQRQTLRDELVKTEWNVFLTLLFHRYYPLEVGHKLIHRWDGLVNSELVGRRYNKDTNSNKRMVYFGCSGFDGQKHLHTHLLIKVPLEWKRREFEGVFEESFRSVGEGDRVRRKGKYRFRGKVYFSPNDKGFFDKTDTENIVSYTTLHRHLGLDNRGLLDTSSIVFSNNYEMKM